LPGFTGGGGADHQIAPHQDFGGARGEVVVADLLQACADPVVERLISEQLS